MHLCSLMFAINKWNVQYHIKYVRRNFCKDTILLPCSNICDYTICKQQKYCNQAAATLYSIATDPFCGYSATFLHCENESHTQLYTSKPKAIKHGLSHTYILVITDNFMRYLAIFRSHIIVILEPT